MVVAVVALAIAIASNIGVSTVTSNANLTNVQKTNNKLLHLFRKYTFHAGHVIIKH